MAVILGVDVAWDINFINQAEGTAEAVTTTKGSTPPVFLHLHHHRGATRTNLLHNSPIPTISTSSADAVDTAYGRGSVPLITYWYTSISTYKGTVCLSKL